MINLKDKTALLTASGQGIGKATAEAFAEAGAYVIATDINHKSLSLLKDVVNETHILDVTDYNKIKKLVSSIKAPDILFNCAGIVHNGTILESTDDDWDLAFNLNSKSMYHMIKEILPVMINKGGGSIINISSIMGKRASAAQAVYSATKHGVVGLTKSIAQDYASFNLRANAIGPGAVETPMVEDIKDDKMIIDLMNSRIPLKRFGQPEEIANLIYFLANNDSSYITGSYIPIDGGYLAS